MCENDFTAAVVCVSAVALGVCVLCVYVCVRVCVLLYMCVVCVVSHVSGAGLQVAERGDSPGEAQLRGAAAEQPLELRGERRQRHAWARALKVKPSPRRPV